VNNSYAQKIILSGKIVDSPTEESIPGVNIHVKDRIVGTVSGNDGSFHLETNSPVPFVLVFSYIGYVTQELEINSSLDNIQIVMSEQIMLEDEVIVSASRIKESIFLAPVSVEKLTYKDFSEQPASDFYEGLYQLKGVDMVVHSLTFQTPNTRGFNGETNLRMNQVVDGVNNVSPGLSFAAGNIFGTNPMDIETLEFVVGASSALYGPGGMNGTLVMNSKNPFNYQGLSVSGKTGLMHVDADYRENPAPMYEVALRFAHAFSDKIAFKVTGSYLAAEDWHASDYRDKNDLNNASSTRESNPGYDGVNIYGDDVVAPVNLEDIGPAVAHNVATSQGYDPDTPEYENLYNNTIQHFPDQLITRTGWVEDDFIDYNIDNLKLAGALHYRLLEKVEGVVQANYARGSSAYTAQNRFSLKDFSLLTAKIEFNGPNYFVRSYLISEDSGGSFDAGGTGLRMNEAWKPSEQWYADYIETYTTQVLVGNSEDEAHRFARVVSDNRDELGNVFNSSRAAFPIGGSPEFEQIFNDIVSKPTSEGGAQVIDKSKLWQIEGMYDFSAMIKHFDLLVGASHRIYSINSEGTVFFDKPGEPIGIWELGAYAQASKSFFADKLKFTLSTRYDKNKNFKGAFTPRLSLVFEIGSKKLHIIRASYQTAFRFPSISDQWVDVDVGAFRIIGGVPEVHSAYDFDTNPVYPLSGTNPITDDPVLEDGPFIVPEFTTEKVKSIEIGYRGLFFNRVLYLDSYIFRNRYDGFHATQSLVQNPGTPEEQRYQTTISTEEPVDAYGWAVGADVRLSEGFLVRGNVSINLLESIADKEPGYQSRFNTPRTRFNVALINPVFYRKLGFSLNYRWQDKFLWESNFGVADIPAYSTLDASLFYPISKINSVVKIGATNLLNSYYTTSYGSAQVGGLYYVSLVYDKMWK
jgi:outer membrane cobalamin receptor